MIDETLAEMYYEFPIISPLNGAALPVFRCDGAGSVRCGKGTQAGVNFPSIQRVEILIR